MALLGLWGCGSPDEPRDILPPLDTLIVRVELDTVYVGDTIVAEALTIDSLGHLDNPDLDYPVAWSASDSSVLGFVPFFAAAIKVTGRSRGSALVMAAADGFSDSARVTVRERVGIVTIQPRPLLVTIGDTVEFTVVLEDTAGNILTDRPVTWEATTGSEQVILEQTGRVIVYGGGTATIKASSETKSDTLPLMFTADAALEELAVGEDFGCVVSALATAYCWGFNGWGEVGTGTVVEASYSTMRRVSGGIGFARLAARTKSACGLSTGGAAWCWGFDDAGQLGNPSGEQSCFLGPCRGEPMLVSGAPAFDSLALGRTHGCGITPGGAAWCWGSNDKGQLGTGSSEAAQHGAEAVTGIGSVRAIAAGAAHTCALDNGGSAWCWGENTRGELGLDSTDELAHGTPAAVSGGHTFQAIAAAMSYTCGLTGGGALYCWGTNELGQLGIGGGDASAHPAPTAAAPGLTFTALATGDRHACALTSDGQGYCWGENQHGQLGQAGATQVCQYFSAFYPCSGSPVAVSGGLRFDTIRVGTYTTCGRATGGVVYCWGANGVGQLGDQTFDNKVIPTRVAGQL